jgi:hypothetical protein
MANSAGQYGGGRGSLWRIAGWGIAGLLLLVPLAGNFPWTGSDYVFAAVMIGGTGLLFELVIRKSSNPVYRAGVGAALAGAFLTIWANGAVGMIGSEDNSYNLLFGGVLLVALAGSIVARFRAAGMMWAMIAAAVADVAVAAGGLTQDPRGAVFSMGFGGIWLLAAGLFWVAGRREAVRVG